MAEPSRVAHYYRSRSGPKHNIRCESGRDVASAIRDPPQRTPQNECGVHLAPSEVEGFGHTIGEALSCGAILITSNAPPMNEVVGSSGAFLVDVESSEPMGHGMRYKVSRSSLEAAVEAVMRLTPEQRRD